MKQKLYIAGKVTGLDRETVVKNFTVLKEYFTGKGFEVVSPIDIVTDPETDWKAAMKICIAALIDCDVVYMMNNSVWSKGARLELSIAKDFDKSIIDYAAADVTTSEYVPCFKEGGTLNVNIFGREYDGIYKNGEISVEKLKNKTSHL